MELSLNNMFNESHPLSNELTNSEEAGDAAQTIKLHGLKYLFCQLF
jgi:hypothetical protein